MGRNGEIGHLASRSMRGLTVNLDDEASDTLRDFADEHGVSVTGLVNGLGELLEGATDFTLAQLIMRARDVDRRRRARPRG